MTATHSPVGSVRGRPRGVRRQSRAGVAFVAAYLVLLIAFGVVPTAYAVYFAFSNAQGAFTGFDNFVTTMRDFRFVPPSGTSGSTCCSGSSRSW